MNPINVSRDMIIDNLYVTVVLGRDLFEKILWRYGKDGWNAYVRKLRQHSIWAMYSTLEPATDDDHCMPVCLQVDWKALSFLGTDLSGLDLLIPEMGHCNFDGADLSESTLGNVRQASFRGACLRGARFEGDITGCDFSGADIEGTVFDGAVYSRQEPPLSLPKAVLVHCSPGPAHSDLEMKTEQDDERHQLTVKRAEICSFWGELK